MFAALEQWSLCLARCSCASLVQGSLNLAQCSCMHEIKANGCLRPSGFKRGKPAAVVGGLIGMSWRAGRHELSASNTSSVGLHVTYGSHQA
eukprot:scaffold5669_cov22-Tisochrysis_lutea.AAC.2